MPIFNFGGLDLFTKSGSIVTMDNVTLDSNVTIPAAGVTGTLGSGVVFPAGHILGSACIVDVTDGNAGGSSGSNSLRVLNTVLYEVGFSVTLGSNEWTFDEAGSYLISASAPGYASDGYIIRLYSGTGSTLEATGTSSQSGSANATTNRSFLNTKLVILDSEKTSGTAKSFGVYMIVETPRAANGFGIGIADSTVEQFTQVQIFKIQE